MMSMFNLPRRVPIASVCLLVSIFAADLTAEPTAPETTKRRTGPVRLDGHSLADDGGKFNALGASLFYGAWAYKNDRPRLERNLKTLADNGFDYIRVIGTV